MSIEVKLGYKRKYETAAILINSDCILMAFIISDFRVHQHQVNQQSCLLNSFNYSINLFAVADLVNHR